MKFIIIVASLLSTSALADGQFTSTYNGTTTQTRCYNSFYSGINCTTVRFENEPAAPLNTKPNTNPDWGKNCSSCIDVSKDRK